VGLYFVQQCLDIGGFSVCDFPHDTYLVSGTLRCVLDFWKLCAFLDGVIQSLLSAMSPVFCPS
jgi:hypothetical protein